MKRLFRIVRGLFYAAIIVVVLVVGIGAWLVLRAWPQTSGTIALAGLDQPVRVVRDKFGIPNIYAKTEHDLFFAQGYVHAQDRLWQMHFNRIICRGGLSAVLGESMIESDRYMRTIGLCRAAEKDWALLGPEPRACLEAYSAGVNAFVDTHRHSLPAEFAILRMSPEAWTPIDSIAWSKMMALSMSQNHSVELKRAEMIARLGSQMAQDLMPPYPDDAAVIIPPEARSYAGMQASLPARPEGVTELLGELGRTGGSNSWVVAGSKTETGKPILSNDTHLSLGMPSIWYENGLHGAGFDCAGYSLPGSPLVIIGHNDRIAWGISNMCSDVQDLFIEKLDDNDNPTQYQAGDRWEKLEVVEERIRVEGKPDEIYKVLVTRHGPLINSVYDLDDSTPMAFRWTALDGGRLIEAVRDLDRAKDWAQFRQALANWDAPSMNFVYADIDGNIGYQATGKIPVRPDGDQGLVPMPGDSGEFEWQGFIPFEELPSVFNPATGFIVAANNKVVPDSYPYHVAYDYGDPYRATRLAQLLSSGEKLSFKAAEEIQGEVYSLPAEALRPYLLAVKPQNELQRKALERVREWDLRFTEDSVGASIYYLWYWSLSPNIVGNKMTDDLKDFRGATPMIVELMSQPDSRWFDDKQTAKIERRDDVVQKSFVEAIDWLTAHHGQDMDQWTWGRMHTMTFVHNTIRPMGIGAIDHIFNSKTIPLSGEAFTVNSSGSSKKRLFAVVFGVSQRMLVDLSDLERSESVNSTGQSGLPFHHNRDDQIQLWREAKYHPMPFREDAVEAQAESTLVLTPR
ncbi:MAG: penicillin acylase family protein [Acidobacteriota bacterium]